MAKSFRIACRNWWFSLALFAAYLATFRAWAHAESRWIAASSAIISLVLLLLLGWAAKKRYFLTVADALNHSLVILDILLEGVLLRDQISRGYAWCAVGFAILIGGYRGYRLYRLSPGHPDRC